MLQLTPIPPDPVDPRPGTSSTAEPLLVRLGGRTLWRTAELRERVAAGCPGREAWDAWRAAAKGGRP